MSAALKQKPEIKIKLSVLSGPHAGQVFQLAKVPFQIGRGPENDVVLLNDPQVSRTHAQVSLLDRDLEILNLSQKNILLVDGESVQKWKLISQSVFVIGESEIRVEYDLGQAVVSVGPGPTSGAVIPIKKKNPAASPPKPTNTAMAKLPAQGGHPPASAAKSPALRSQAVGARPQRPPGMAVPPGAQLANPLRIAQPGAFARPAQPPQNSLASNPRMKFYLIGLVLIMGAYLFFDQSGSSSQAKKLTSTLRYEDEVNIKLNSQQQKDIEEDRDLRRKEKMSSPQLARIEENFMRGMRDFRLGNYLRAQDFFQLVLNLEPDHALAKRHLYLSRARFDGLVQEKLMLGDSYLKKHNYRMCESMYTQVMNMLQGKNYDEKFKLAEKKAKECALANEGIR